MEEPTSGDRPAVAALGGRGVLQVVVVHGVVGLAVLLPIDPASGQEPSVDPGRLEAAVLPLPTGLRADAGILRWTGTAEMEVLRPSGNGMSCVVDDPGDDRFDVRCYHDDFWAVIRRARRLRTTVDSWDEVDEAIRAEADDGTLAMPATPTAGYRMLGPADALDAATLTAGPEIRRWQSIHFPFRTAAELGLTEDEEPNKSPLPGLVPYVMASGTWWSHVMIVHEPFD